MAVEKETRSIVKDSTVITGRKVNKFDDSWERNQPSNTAEEEDVDSSRDQQQAMPVSILRQAAAPNSIPKRQKYHTKKPAEPCLIHSRRGLESPRGEERDVAIDISAAPISDYAEFCANSV